MNFIQNKIPVFIIITICFIYNIVFAQTENITLNNNKNPNLKKQTIIIICSNDKKNVAEIAVSSLKTSLNYNELEISHKHNCNFDLTVLKKNEYHLKIETKPNKKMFMQIKNSKGTIHKKEIPWLKNKRLLFEFK